MVVVGAVAFGLALTLLGNPVDNVTGLLEEARNVVAQPADPAGEPVQLVPRRGAADVNRAPAPRLLDLDRAGAQALAEADGFSIVFDESFSESVPRGQVMTQRPAAASPHSRDEPLIATVSLGRARAPVPSVVGLAATVARAALEARGFQVLEISAFSDDIAPDSVLGQEPLAGTIAERRSVVALQVSRGVESVSVPPLVGRGEDDARRSLELAGLRLGPVAYTESGGVPNGVVETQSPATGTLVPKGSEVTLGVVRVGEATVPPVIGLSESDAAQALLDRGLLVGALTRIPTPGRTVDEVTGQEPGAGARVPRGFGVRLVVAVPGQTTPVPTDPEVERPSG